MEDKKVMKNMEYWKKKNNIPGIEALDMAGLTDGRAGSSAFQMATPGSSPNKINLLRALSGGMLGKGGWGGKMLKGDFKSGVGQMLNPFSAFGGGGGGGANQALAQSTAVGQPPIDPTMVDPTMLATQQAALAGGGGITMKKSPMKQEEDVLGGQEIAMQSQDETGNWMLDEENGELRTTEQFGGEEGILINDPDDVLGGRTMGDDDFNYRYKVEEDGSYTLISKGPSEGTESPSEENVPTGPMGPGGMDITGGVGGPQMQSPVKNYKNPQDYKVFNFGNEPTPFEKRKKKY